MIHRLRNLPRGVKLKEQINQVSMKTLATLALLLGAASAFAPRAVAVTRARVVPRATGLEAVDIPASMLTSATTFSGNVVSESTVVPFLDDTAVIGFLAIAFPCAVVFATIFAPRNA